MDFLCDIILFIEIFSFQRMNKVAPKDNFPLPHTVDKDHAVAIASSTVRAHIILNEEAISHLFECDESAKHAVFRCRICLYSTLKKNNIENHVITHTDLHSFKCHLCPYESKYKKDLLDHCNLNHEDSNVKF